MKCCEAPKALPATETKDGRLLVVPTAALKKQPDGPGFKIAEDSLPRVSTFLTSDAQGAAADRILALLESVHKEQNDLRSVFQTLEEGLVSRLDRIEKSVGSFTIPNEAFQLSTMLQNVDSAEPEDVENTDQANDLEEEARKWFTSTDKDHSGALSVQELKALLVNWSMSTKQTFRDVLDIRTEADLERLITAADADGNGEIDEDEFIEIIKMRKAEQMNGLVEVGEKPRMSDLFGKSTTDSLVGRIVSSLYFEAVTGFIIAANLAVMCVSLQVDGLALGSQLGLRRDDGAGLSKATSDFLEKIFNGIYLAELLLRFYAQSLHCHFGASDVADSALVILSCLDCFVLQPLKLQFISLSVLRMARLAKFGKFFKVLRVSEHCSELRVLVLTLRYALRGAFWSIALLSGIITSGGIFMTQLSQPFIADGQVELERREWMYRRFGTVTSSMYTMFESTFPGSWAAISRPLMEEVHYAFVVFWVLWVVLVTFVTMRVVGAVFLHQTMMVNDAEHEKRAMTQAKTKGQMSETLRMLFRAADTSGDGGVSQQEFEHMISHEKVVEEFAQMGMDIDTVREFFSVLLAEDGTADYNEFISGALAMATTSPGMDRIKRLAEKKHMEGELKEIKDTVLSVKKLLTPKKRNVRNGAA